MTPHPAPRILICRLSAIGDCILTTPLLCALRARFPHAFLAWAVERPAAPLLQDHPCLDRLIVLPKGWLTSPRKVAQTRQELRALRFDIAVDPQSLTKSALLAWLAGASHRIGFAPPRGRELSVWLNNCLVRPTLPHLVDAQLQLLEPLGIDHPSVKFQLPCRTAVVEQVDQLLTSLHLGCPFAVINVGAGWDSRLWPTSRYGRVARFLGETRQIPSLVVWAGDREQAWARDVVANSGGHALVAPPTSLPELHAVLRRARLFIGSDTGPMHLAAAAGTPCVALFGTTRPEESGPYGANHSRIQTRFQAGSSRTRRRAANIAMTEITCDMVFEACRQLLDRIEQQDQHGRAA